MMRVRIPQGSVYSAGVRLEEWSAVRVEIGAAPRCTVWSTEGAGGGAREGSVVSVRIGAEVVFTGEVVRRVASESGAVLLEAQTSAVKLSRTIDDARYWGQTTVLDILQELGNEYGIRVVDEVVPVVEMKRYQLEPMSVGAALMRVSDVASRSLGEAVEWYWDSRNGLRFGVRSALRGKQWRIERELVREVFGGGAVIVSAAHGVRYKDVVTFAKGVGLGRMEVVGGVYELERGGAETMMLYSAP